jgi:polyisoprenoid-binding protein YceI
MERRHRCHKRGLSFVLRAGNRNHRLQKGAHVTSTETSTTNLSRLPGTWALDPEKTTVTFRTKALWVLPVRGTAKALSGEAQVSADAVTGTLVIDAASFDTKNKKRDDHLRSEDFLEVVKYPTIVFTTNGARPTGAGRVEIAGELTVHGRTQPVALQAQVSGSGNSATVSTEVEIDRSLWGISWAKMGTGLKNEVAIRAHFNRA